jgi:hypothetical protein
MKKKFSTRILSVPNSQAVQSSFYSRTYAETGFLGEYFFSAFDIGKKPGFFGINGYLIDAPIFLIISNPVN